MTDMEIRLRCLEASVNVMRVRIVSRSEAMRTTESKQIFDRANAFFTWVTTGVPSDYERPFSEPASYPAETGPELPEHTGWAG